MTNVFMVNIFMTSVFMTSNFMTKITEPVTALRFGMAVVLKRYNMEL